MTPEERTMDSERGIRAPAVTQRSGYGGKRTSREVSDTWTIGQGERYGGSEDDVADYWHKNWTCPFFVRSDKKRVCCEGGCIQSFPDVETAKEFMERLCASKNRNWESCSLASALLRYYERKENENDEQSTEKQN